VDLATRVRAAVDRVRSALRSHGGTVELLDVNDGVVRVRVETGGRSCPSSAGTLRQMIERAVYDAAPDVAALEVEGLAPAATDGLVQLGLRLPPDGAARPAVNQTVGSRF
jgi:Fe-S cluster biogenesis protein NfuA